MRLPHQVVIFCPWRLIPQRPVQAVFMDALLGLEIPLCFQEERWWQSVARDHTMDLCHLLLPLIGIWILPKFRIELLLCHLFRKVLQGRVTRRNLKEFLLLLLLHRAPNRPPQAPSLPAQLEMPPPHPPLGEDPRRTMLAMFRELSPRS